MPRSTYAFNSIHRRSFLKVIGERFPGLWNWAWSNYGAPTELYVRRDNLAPVPGDHSEQIRHEAR